MPVLRPVTDGDVEEVLALNQRNVVKLAPMDAARLEELRGWADRVDVLDVDGAFGGFVITFGPGTAYDSDNYRWFTERYGDDFYYLDRIVLHERYRRQGLGGFVYDEVEVVARRYGRMALEVNLVPRNDASLAFHEARGYVEVGRRSLGGEPRARLEGPGEEDHVVSLMEKTWGDGA